VAIIITKKNRPYSNQWVATNSSEKRALNLSASQMKGSAKSGAQYEVDIPDAYEKDMKSSMRTGKGMQIKKGDVQKATKMPKGAVGGSMRPISGGDIFSDAGKSISKVANDAVKTVTGKSSKSWGKSLKAAAESAAEAAEPVAEVADKAVKKTTGKTTKSIVKSAGKVVKDAYQTVNKTALKQDWGSAIEEAQSVIPQSAVTQALKLAFISGGMDPNAASVAAGSATGAFYDVDFSKSLKGQGKTALKGAVKGGVKEGMSASKTKTETKGGAILDQKGIGNINSDEGKQAITRGGGMIKHNLVKPLEKMVSHQAAVQDAQVADPNEMFKGVPKKKTKGGSMRPISGGSMRPIEGGSMRPIEGGSMRPISGGAVKPKSFAKGSQEAKDYMASLRERRKKK
jgi:hypothetical protein